MDGLDRQGLDARVLAGTRVAAIGPGTAARAHGLGHRARTWCPSARSRSRSPRSSIAQGVADQRVLIARAAEARDVLPRELEQAGADVQVVPLYETVRERLDEQQLERLAGADYVTFTSSSTVRFLLEAIGGVERFPARARVVSIGPVTSADRARARPRGRTSRPSATTSTASSTRCCATRRRPRRRRRA